jgi:hypothetical protein
METDPLRLIFNARPSDHATSTGPTDDHAITIPSRDPVVQLTPAGDASEVKKVPRQRAGIPTNEPDTSEQPDPFGPAIDWAFRCYDVKLDGPAAGQVFQRSLYLFNLIVALEWQPDEGYIQMLQSAFTRASDLLFDITDGWMALGQVVFGGPELMGCADIQIMASSRLLSRAWVAALHEDHKYMPIRVGRGLWNDNRRGVIAWEEPEGYRTLVHEWGHYALCLTDEYLEVRQLVFPELVRHAGESLSLVRSPLATVVMPSVGSFSDSIMSTTEGTSEIVSKQWHKLSARFPRVPNKRADRQVLAGPRWLPMALPRFRRHGPLTQPLASPTAALPAWNSLRGQLARLGVPGDLQLDHCWVYLLRGAGSGDHEPERIIAQGTLEHRSADESFALLGARDGDAVVLIAEQRGQQPVVLRARVAGDRVKDWSVAGPGAFPSVDVVPEPAEQNARKAEISVRIGDGEVPERVMVFPLGSTGPLDISRQKGAKNAAWASKPRAIPTLDGHVLASWGKDGDQILISSFSQGGGPATISPFPANPITAGSADGGAMLFFNKGRDNDSTYAHVKVVATIEHGLGGTPASWLERGYAYSLAGNDALPQELTPTLVMYYDPIAADEEAALADGDLRICRWDAGGWTPLPTYIPPGYRFAVTPLRHDTAGSLVAPAPGGPRVEYYKVCWVPRAS